MNDLELFYKNLELWAQQDSQAAFQLSCLAPKKKGDSPAQSCQDALEKARRWFAQLQLESSQILCIYGIGLGYEYEAAKEWLEKDSVRQLVFLEDDLEAIYSFLHTSQATDLLSNDRVFLLYFRELEGDTAVLLTELYWNFINTKIAIVASADYAQAKEKEFLLLEHKILHDFALRDALIDEYLKYGAAFFRNFYPNMLQLPRSYLGNALFEQFKGVPAIICGAGPSLSKQLPLIQELQNQGRALIFAGGSALNACANAGLRPHFGAGIDPNPEQEVRLRGHQIRDLPFFYRNRIYSPALNLIAGPRLYITGSGGYDVARWFEQELDIASSAEEEVDEGFNVVGFCMAIAHAMGCDPLILVGVDLAYTNMQTYASGVLADQKMDAELISKSKEKSLDEFAFIKTDIYARPVYTAWKWVAESQWIGEFAKKHAEIQLINATEGGIGMPGVVNESLNSVAKTYLQEGRPLREMVTQAIEKASMPEVSIGKVEACFETMKHSLEKAIDHLQILLEDSKRIEKQTIDKESTEESTQSGSAALAEVELAEEPAYMAILEIFNIVYSKILNRKMQLILTSSEPEWRQFVKKQQLNQTRLQYLQDVAKANIALMDHACAHAQR